MFFENWLLSSFLSFLFVVYVSYTLNVRFTDRIVNITSPEDCVFTYYKSVRGYSNSSVKEAQAKKNPGLTLNERQVFL